MKALALSALIWAIALFCFFVVVPAFLAWDYLDHAVTDLISEGMA